MDNLRATLNTIRDTWRYHLPPPDWAKAAWLPPSPIPRDDVAALRSSIVEQIFAYLELTYGPCAADQRAFFLYSDWSRKDTTGLCLVLPYLADIEGRDQRMGLIPKGRNHAQQLIRLLREHNLQWGVLTNGRHWRLFHRSALSPTDTYLHVDLERILVTEDIRSYIVFHRFFGRTAFARQQDLQQLELYRQRSDQATTVIEEHLSAQVEEILRQLCQGLAESCAAAGEEVASERARSEIYRNALYLIYRLLFVLYAEARELLPLDAPAYRARCLRDLVAEVRENHRGGLHYDNDYVLCERLDALFALIDQGKADAGVPAYNGGLFDPGRRPFLARHRVRNTYLQAALIRLCTIPGKGSGYDQDREPAAIDYRDLSVRHLGSLYEGLLECGLFLVEDEPRVVRAGQKRIEYVPYSKAGKVRASETLLQVGDVYVSQTAGERKATGSYYTPEDVVDYIVSRTVGEKLAELRAAFYASNSIERQLADLSDTPATIPAHRHIQQALDEQFLRCVREQVLGLRILDPAMGSGHFLVNATHAVANFIVEFLSETPWENAVVDTDVATWKRQVAEHCIFGVDLNELAVELAKLCLWMTTAAKGKPLTFLDHHLRWGNSLVGAWLRDVGVYPLAKKKGEPSFTLPLGSFQVELSELLAGYRELYAKDSDDVEEVRQKARIFDQELTPALDRYRELLDLHTSVYFGSGPDEATYAAAGIAVQDPEAWVRLLSQPSAGSPRRQEHRWFHWELEFPEAFAGEKGGFDVVLGNPPYASFPEDLPAGLLTVQYRTADCGDLYALFLERATQVARGTTSYLGFIVPLSITFSSRLASARIMLGAEARMWDVHSFDKRPQAIFPGVQQRTSILIGRSSLERKCVRSGPLLRWRPEDRATLFAGLRTFDCSDLMLPIGMPKLGSELQATALRRLLSMDRAVKHHLANDDGNTGGAQQDYSGLYFFGVAYRWLVTAKQLPPSVSPQGTSVNLSGFSMLRFHDERASWSYLAVLNSLTAFWFWLVYGDSFHVTRSLLASCPIDIDQLSGDAQGRLVQLGVELQREMLEHVFYGTMRGQTVANYDLLACRHITDKVDELLVDQLRLGGDFLTDVRRFCSAAAGL